MQFLDPNYTVCLEQHCAVWMYQLMWGLIWSLPYTPLHLGVFESSVFTQVTESQNKH